MKKYFVSIILLITFIGCASSKLAKPSIQDTVVIHSSFDNVWSGIMSTVMEKEWPIDFIDKENGILTTKPIILFSGISVSKHIEKTFVKPSFIMGNWTQLEFYINIYVKSNNKKNSTIKIISHAKAFENTQTRTWHVCYSKGIIEKEFIDSVNSIIEKNNR